MIILHPHFDSVSAVSQLCPPDVVCSPDFSSNKWFMWLVVGVEQDPQNAKWFLSGFMWFKRFLAGLSGADVVWT